MSFLVQGLAALSAFQPQPPTLEYDGLEYRWKMFTFRPAEYKLEAALFSAIAVYLLIYLLGKTYNMSRARSIFAPYQSLLNSNFTATRPLVASGPSQHLSYSSGRRNALALQGTLILQPYHDVAGILTTLVKSVIEPTYDSSEGMIWHLTLGRGDAGLQGEGLGVWGIVNKSNLRFVKQQRWDLTFPKIQENASVPFTHTLYTEHSDVTDAIIKTPNVGVTDLLANAKAADVLKYLLITDQPAQRPAKGPLPAKFRSRQVILSVRVPRNSFETDAVKAWLQVALNIADLTSKPNVIKPEVARKLTATRKTVDAELEQAYAKEQAEDSPAEMTAEEKTLAKKKAARANLSERELKRLDELEKKREMRKLQKRGGLKTQ